MHSALFVLAALAVVPLAGAAFAEDLGISIVGGASDPACADSETGCFDPVALDASIGDTVIWQNDDSAVHAITSGDYPAGHGADGIFYEFPLVPGSEFSYEFVSPGFYPYHCALHPWMVGSVLVEPPSGEDAPVPFVRAREGPHPPGKPIQIDMHITPPVRAQANLMVKHPFGFPVFFDSTYLPLDGKATVIADTIGWSPGRYEVSATYTVAGKFPPIRYGPVTDDFILGGEPIGSDPLKPDKLVIIRPGGFEQDCGGGPCYDLPVTEALVGQFVAWVNEDSDLHTVTSDVVHAEFDSGLIRPGEVFSYQFGVVGAHEYYCLIHPWMQGTVQVSEGTVDGPDFDPAFVQVEIGVDKDAYETGQELWFSVDSSPSVSVPASLVLEHESGSKIYSEQITLSEKGNYREWLVPDASWPPGMYTAHATYYDDGELTGYDTDTFDLGAFPHDPFIKVEKDQYHLGEEVMVSTGVNPEGHDVIFRITVDHDAFSNTRHNHHYEAAPDGSGQAEIHTFGWHPGVHSAVVTYYTDDGLIIGTAHDEFEVIEGPDEMISGMLAPTAKDAVPEGAVHPEDPKAQKIDSIIDDKAQDALDYMVPYIASAAPVPGLVAGQDAHVKVVFSKPLYDHALVTVGIAVGDRWLGLGHVHAGHEAAELIVPVLMADAGALDISEAAIYVNAYSSWPSEGGLAIVAEYQAAAEIGAGGP